jgi:glycosyltransferase involved in cell wall biosynthesis
MKRICHLSSVHRGLDIRIFWKECMSLAKAGYDTHLVINATAADVAEAAAHGVTVHGMECEQSAGRFSRMSVHAWRCYQIAKSLDADIYHFHDPELIPYGVLLTWAGKKVIFDVHEDLSGDIYSKDWIPLHARYAVAATARAVENFGARRFSAVVAATSYIGTIFEGVAERAVVVNNYPLPGELSSPQHDDSWQRDSVCYVGGIDAIRGIRQVVQALSDIEITLHLAGHFSSPQLLAGVSNLSGWTRVKYHGILNRREVTKIFGRSLAGLVTFLPEPNHINSQPNKMFEYMSAGVPVIASDFPIWHELIEGTQCGICVDPSKPEEISAAIRHLQNHPEEVARMGNNGRQAVEEKYRWDWEEMKLVSLYQDILGM